MQFECINTLVFLSSMNQCESKEGWREGKDDRERMGQWKRLKEASFGREQSIVKEGGKNKHRYIHMHRKHIMLHKTVIVYEWFS